MLTSAHISVDISMNGQKLQEMTMHYQLPGCNVVHGWHLLSRKIRQDCPSKSSNGQMK